jgi:hypothetical protein
MFRSVGELLPLAVGVSISPLPIIAVIVLLMSPHARISAPAFLLGWMAAIISALLVFAALSDVGLGTGGHPAAAATVRLVLGAGLLFLAYTEWRSRPAAGEAAPLPHWLSAVEKMGPLPAAGLGFGIYAANPKNLTVGVAAGVAFGSADLTFEAGALVCLIYVLVAASTVYVPVAAYLIAEERARPWLHSMRGWLVQHNAAVMAVLLLVIGSMMVGKGIAALES